MNLNRDKLVESSIYSTAHCACTTVTYLTETKRQIYGVVQATI